jgi:hypothetical protein
MEEERIITPLPKAMPIAATVLLLLGIVSTQFVQNVFSEEQLARNALLSGIPFVLIFAAIVLYFMSFAWFVSNRLNFRISTRTFQLFERISIGGIVLGIIMMFQPWVFELFRYGFFLLLLSTLFFIVWSHVTPSLPEDDVAADMTTN